MQRRLLLSFASAALAAFALSTSGCLAVFSGVHSTDITFPLDRKPDASFWAWNEITVDGDISSVNSATLVSVSLSINTPAGADFSFLQSLKGEAVTPTARTTVAEIDMIPAGQQTIVMRILYTGDLHPLFKDQHTIRIEWSGETNPAFSPWPTGGFSITGSVDIDIE